MTRLRLHKRGSMSAPVYLRAGAIGFLAATLLMTVSAAGQGMGPPGPRSEAEEESQEFSHGWGSPWHQSGGRQMEPAQLCKEHFAREAGFVAYLGARLELTSQQQPLWQSYEKQMMDGAEKQRQACLDNIASSSQTETALDRRDRLEKLLTAQLDALRSSRDSLNELYRSFSPEQRALVDHIQSRRFDLDE